ncbi:RNA-directed DNA polymerase from mobile element jockey [Aphis craccivora]|uniref:RNA-directed DNA polymerase from mobile element jockey n=1 Tax=Aphis craccivora TaxID=307492 RepID=A0A6G0YX19_APHCR|nr:RNA-directed DNA polymerase from mobile element jockey [Aphis craccivora]
MHIHSYQRNQNSINYLSYANPIIFNYSISNYNLELVSNFKDLEIIFDSKLNFSYHTEFIKNKAMRILDFIKRSCEDFRDPFALKILYCSLIRSNLEYYPLILINNTSKQNDTTEATHTAHLEMSPLLGIFISFNKSNKINDKPLIIHYFSQNLIKKILKIFIIIEQLTTIECIKTDNKTLFPHIHTALFKIYLQKKNTSLVIRFCRFRKLEKH